jgi:hypothetical protein
MHSLNHPAMGHAVAAERVESGNRHGRAHPSLHPPPVRSRLAYKAARMARRLDPVAARRAVA